MMQDENCRAGRKFIPVGEAFAEWDKELEFRAAYDALEEEFVTAQIAIGARADAGRISSERAPRVGTVTS